MAWGCRKGKVRKEYPIGMALDTADVEELIIQCNKSTKILSSSAAKTTDGITMRAT